MARTSSHSTEASGPSSPPVHTQLRRIAGVVVHRYRDEDLGTTAAGIALFALIALPASILAVGAIYGLVANEGDVWEHVAWLGRFVPTEVAIFLRDQMQYTTSTASGSLSLAAIGALLLALVGAHQSVAATMSALNRVGHLPDQRSFWKRHLVAMALTILGIVLTVGGIIALVALPAIAEALGWPGRIWSVLIALRWPIAFAVVSGYLGLMYRVTPSRRVITARGAFYGAIAGAGLWLGASVTLSWWVSGIADYPGMYGAAGSLLVVLLWFYLSALAVLLGGLISAETR